MSIASRITSMEQHIGNAYDKLDELGVDLTNVDKNLDNIAELLDGVYEEYPKIEENDVTEPSINNTKAGKMKIDLKGNTYQNTDNNNILNMATKTVSWQGTSIVYSGKTITINKTGTGGVSYNPQTDLIPLVAKSGTKIKFSLTYKSGTINLDGSYSYRIGCYCVDTNGDTDISNRFEISLNYNTSTPSGEVEFELPIDVIGFKLGSYISQNCNTTNGDVIWDAEIKYAGDVPNPNVERKVEVVSGENKVKVVNKNLFDKNNVNKLNGYFESSGDTIKSSDYNRTIYIPCKPSTTYAITQGTSSLSNHLFQLATTNEKPQLGVTVYNFDSTHSASSIFTYTTNSTARYLVMRIRSGDDISTFYDGVQIEENSTATTYEPHKEQDFPISLHSRNLFDKNTETVGWVYSSTGTWAEAAVWNTSDWIQVNSSNQYKLSSKTTGTGNLFFSEFDINKQFIQRTTTTNLTPAVNTKYIRLSYKNDLGTYDIQIEEGSTATAYQPYYNYELCKIGEYQDYIYKNNGSWYIKKMIEKIILNGTQGNWDKGSLSNQNYSIFQAAGFLLKILKGTTTLLYSNKFISKDNLIAPTLDFESVYIGSEPNSPIRISIKNSRLNEVNSNGFNQWLTQNNTEVYGVRQTPIDIGIPDTILISQLNALEKAKSYDDTTNIIQENNDLPFILDIKTLKKS